jgi:GDPmannose 4,6-dehydratase
MWLMLQKKSPDDYVIATQHQYSVKQFIEKACKYLDIKIKWKGKGLNEVGINKKNNKIIICCDKKYFRPTEVDTLLGNSYNEEKYLKGKTRINLVYLVQERVFNDLKLLN